MWVSVGTGGNWVATSYDGVIWTAQDSAVFTEGYYVAWNGTVFVAAGTGNGNTLATSPDGAIWTAVNTTASVFSRYASFAGWTGNVWCAVGSGGNTTATCSSVYGNVWVSSAVDLMVTDLSSIVTDMTTTTSSSSGVSALAFDNSWNLTVGSYPNTEWITATASYNADGTASSLYTTPVTTADNLVNGEYIQVATSSPVVLQYYLLLFNVSGGVNLYETPKTWYVLGANTETPTAWNILDTFSAPLTTPPSYGANKYVGTPIAISNTTAYQYYRILFTSTFSSGSAGYARVMEMDFFIANSTSTDVINPRIRPFIVPNGVVYPVRMKLNKYNFVLYADRDNNPVNSCVFGSSYYSTDASGLENYTNTGFITGFSFDGTNCLATSSGAGVASAAYTGDFGKTWAASSIGAYSMTNINANCFNGTYFIVGGNTAVTGGNVLLYSKTEYGLNNWYPSINGNVLFTSVYGFATNPGYGFTVPNNSIYLGQGQKLGIITPKNYPYSAVAGDVHIGVNLNTYPASL
jgi:hypothetical protein